MVEIVFYFDQPDRYQSITEVPRNETSEWSQRQLRHSELLSLQVDAQWLLQSINAIWSGFAEHGYCSNGLRGYLTNSRAFAYGRGFHSFQACHMKGSKNWANNELFSKANDKRDRVISTAAFLSPLMLLRATYVEALAISVQSNLTQMKHSASLQKQKI